MIYIWYYPSFDGCLHKKGVSGNNADLNGIDHSYHMEQDIDVIILSKRYCGGTEIS